ncbi:MAG: AAA family ATPase [Phycisphaeraceae bacterium]|nr:AAA family ATPase [Phycisphaeraceae bacterium]
MSDAGSNESPIRARPRMSAFHLGNFKAFGATQRVPLRPLTIIFGPNSSGKSSIIHGLLFGHEATTNTEPNSLDVVRPRLGGESVDLGGFRQFVHRRDPSNRVEWGIEFEAKNLEGRLQELLGATERLSVIVTVGIRQRQRTTQARIQETATDVEIPGELEQVSAPQVESYRIQTPEGDILRASLKGSGDRRRMGVDELDLEHPVMRSIVEAMVLMATTTGSLDESDRPAIKEAIDGLVPSMSLGGLGLLPTTLHWPRSQSAAGDSPGAEQERLFPISRGSRSDDLVEAVLFYLPRVLNDLVGGMAREVGQTFEFPRTRYLGPLRSYPARHLAFAQDHDSNWDAGGGWAWDRARNDRDVRCRVNEWLGAKWMKTPYRLVVNNLLVESQVTDVLWTALERMSEDGLAIEPDYDRDPEPEGAYPTIKDVEGEVTRFRQLLRQAEVEIVRDLVLLDERRKTFVSHRDIGIGVSQVLPVLVTAFASEGSLLAMEQPELHLHPALQSELGDVVAESAIERGNTFLLETHSEHLLLRIMRRIRETTLGTLPEGCTALRPEDVMVLYVEPERDFSIVREMPLNEHGELVKAWPGGFFEEGLREVF